jgi:hypothetical protein
VNEGARCYSSAAIEAQIADMEDPEEMFLGEYGLTGRA